MRAGATRRFLFLALALGCLITLFYLGSIRHSAAAVGGNPFTHGRRPDQHGNVEVDLKGHVIAAKLGNETAKCVYH